jgi:diguanylate cyclase (GGDEF)-like protein/PAS domain S-box-containing protein
VGIRLLLGGLTLVALFCVLDILTMAFLPHIVAQDRAAAYATELHSYWNLPTSLIGILAIAAGFVYVIKFDLPRVAEGNRLLQQTLDQRAHELATVSDQLRREAAIRQQGEVALKQSEKSLRSYFDAGVIGMARLSGDFRIVHCNEALCSITGYDQQELIGKSWADLTHPDDIEVSGELVQQIEAGARDRYIVEKRYLTKSGQIVYVTTSAECVRKADGSVDYLVGFIQDNTGRIKTEQKLRTYEARLRETQRIARLGFWDWDITSDHFVWSEEVHKIFGLDATTLEENGITAISELIFHPDDRDYVRERVDAVLRGEDPSPIEHRIIRSDGEIRHICVLAEVTRDEHGRAVRLFGTLMDITEQKLAEAALKRSEEMYRALYDENPTMFFTVDREGTIFSVNDYGAKQLGYTRKQLIGRSLFSIFCSEDSQIACKNLRKCIDSPGKVHRWELRKLHKDGSTLWVRETARVVYQSEDVPFALIVCENITKTRQLSEKLSYQASHDALTNLINRGEFERRLSRLIETVSKNNSQHALCYIDLDQFKVINDTCGHVAGDELLRQLGILMQGVVRKRDTLARLGGDEFGILMEHCSLQQANRVATTLLRAIENFRFAWEDRTFVLGASFGLVPIFQSTLSAIEILKRADTACYAAKDAGRNRIHVYKANDETLSERSGEMQWVAQINRALETNKFCLYAQPIARAEPNVSEGEHYELLLRMYEGKNRLVPPGAFLPAAERYNLSARLDRWVIDNYLRWLAANTGHMNRLYQCSINLSGLSIGDEQFLDFLTRRLKQSNVPADKICFEITETAAITSLSRAAAFINKLKSFGCRFALDDFGSGLSSLAYLKALPVDFLKIDGVFVKDIGTDELDLAMVKSINDIGKVMGKKTIAEFVEHEAILQKLRDIGVDYVQGYLIGRPCPIQELILPIAEIS